MTENKNHNVPGVSIDEALELYMSIALNNVKDGEAKDKLLAILREKVAKDRPEWSKSYSNEHQPVDEEKEKRYADIKAQIVEKANAEEIPQDPEEKYLYLRKKEARENSLRKKELDDERQREEALRAALIQEKQTQEDEVLKRAALIKKVILEKARQKMSPQFGLGLSLSNTETAVNPTQQNVVDFSSTVKAPDQKPAENTLAGSELTNEKRHGDGKPDAGEWFKDFKSLTMDDRVKSIREYNIKKREMLQTREQLMWDRQSPRKKKKDEFTLDDTQSVVNTGLSFDSNEKNPRGLQLD